MLTIKINLQLGLVTNNKLQQFLKRKKEKKKKLVAVPISRTKPKFEKFSVNFLKFCT